MRASRLSETGKKLYKLFSEKREKFPEVKLAPLGFNLKEDSMTEFLPNYGLACCPLAIAGLGDPIPIDYVDLSKVNGLRALLEDKLQMPPKYFSGFWHGFDEEKEDVVQGMLSSEGLSEEFKTGYRDGQLFRDLLD